jgi:hypothetical protein
MRIDHILNKSVFKQINKYNIGLKNKFRLTLKECLTIIDFFDKWSIYLMEQCEFVDIKKIHEVNVKYFYDTYLPDIYVNMYEILPYFKNNDFEIRNFNICEYLYNYYNYMPIFQLVDICNPCFSNDNSMDVIWMIQDRCDKINFDVVSLIENKLSKVLID